MASKDTSRLPGVRVEKLLPKVSTPLATQRSLTNVIIGITGGRKVEVLNEAVVRADSGLIDALTYSPVSSISRVGDSENVTDYRNGVDYQVNTGQTGVQWLDNTCSPPILSSPTAIAGGSLTPDTYYFVATWSNAHGETIASNELSITLSETAGVRFNVGGHCDKASTFNVYRGTASGAEVLTHSDSTPNISTYTDTGDTPGVDEPPTSNTAYRKPSAGDTYYTSYKYLTYQYPANSVTGEAAIDYEDTARYFSDLETVQEYHGSDSDVGVAAMLMMAGGGNGFSCPGVYVIGLSQSDVNTDPVAAYDAAIDVLKEIKDTKIRIVPCISHETVLRHMAAHCEEYNDSDKSLPRTVVYGPTAGRVYGPEGTAGTTIELVKSLDYNPYVQVLANTQYRVKVIDEDGDSSYRDYPGWIGAALYAGARGELVTPMYFCGGDKFPTSVQLTDSSSVLPLTNNSAMKALNAYGIMIYDWSAKPSANAAGVFELLQDQTIAVNYSQRRHTGTWETDMAILWDCMRGIANAQPKIIQSPKSDEKADQAKDIINRILGEYLGRGEIAGFSSSNTKFELDTSVTDGTWYLLDFEYDAILPINVITIRRSFTVNFAALT